MSKATTILGAVAIGIAAYVLAATDPITIDIPELNESSGLAFSTRSDELLFSHNDSGDSPRMFAFDRQGRSVYELAVEKAKAQDWEDMCSFEHDSKHWLAVGDIGDNERKRKHVSIYVFREPKEKEGDRKRKAEVEYELRIEYPQGPVDCEALAYDPVTHAFLLLSKETFNCTFFEVPIPAEAAGEVQVTARQIGKCVIPFVTGADISRDGRNLAICTYGPACMIERGTARDENQWVLDPVVVAKHFFEVPHRRQGEAICFAPNSKQVWLTSEHLPTPLIEVDWGGR